MTISQVKFELCEICESNPKENREGKYCESCRDDFKTSDGDQ